MSSIRTVSDTTSADKSSIGFDYQYYFFLWKVLCLQSKQSAGLEYKDDVHTDLDNDIQVLYQLKHTVQKSKSTGKAANMTSLDPELWKTLSNWALLIKDQKAGRELPHEQLKFLQKTVFVLASNKSEAKVNLISSLISDLLDGKIETSKLKDEFRKVVSKSRSEDILKYSNQILTLSDDVLCQFLKNVNFELEQEYILGKCRDAIKAKMIEEKDIDNLFKLIDSSIRESNFLAIKDDKKIIVSFEDFHKKYRKFFQKFQNSNLVIYEFDEALPEDLESLTFIKQLIEINDFDADDLDSMAELTSLMFKAKKNLNTWSSDGDVTDLELASLKRNTRLEWNNEWKKRFREYDESLHNSLAIQLVDKLRTSRITYDVLPDDLTISNGYLYYLSEIPEIGWRKDWSKYKK